jgi:ATP-dependent helicase/nuclease subunit B
MLTILIGRAGTGKTAELFNRILSRGKKRPQILLVPEQASHEAERRLCETGGNGACLYAEVLSFTRLANRVFSSAGGLAEPALDPGGRLLLMYQAVKSVSGQLKAYLRPSQKPAFLSGLLSTADELKSCRISPARLAQAAEETGGAEGERLRDVALICGAYEAISARVAMDPRDRLTRLAEKLPSSGWAEELDVYADGFTDFTPQEREVLRELLLRCNSLTVALTCDKPEDDEHGAGVFSPARHTVARLIRMANDAGMEYRVETVEPGPSRRPPELFFLEQNLFADSIETYNGRPEAVELFHAWTPRSEWSGRPRAFWNW